MTAGRQPADRSPECLSDFALDEWIAGELGDAERTPNAAHVEQCARCQSRLAALEQETAEFLSQAPSLAAHAALTSELPATERKMTRNRMIVTASSGFALAAIVAFAIMPHSPRRTTAATRIKGGVHVDFFIKRDQAVTRGVSGASVHPGDLLRFTYTSVDDAQLALINIDDRGATVYYPRDSNASIPIEAGHSIALDFSVELDDNIGSEHIYGVFCPEPFVLSAAIKGLSGPQPMPPAHCQLDVIVLQKVSPP